MLSFRHDLSGASELHHGDCVGSDENFAKLMEVDIGPERVFVHPPENVRLRAYAIFTDNVVLDPKAYLERNRDIVSACDILIATPKENRESYGGGTWYTIREAVKQGKRIKIVWPDGGTSEKISGIQ